MAKGSFLFHPISSFRRWLLAKAATDLGRFYELQEKEKKTTNQCYKQQLTDRGKNQEGHGGRVLLL